jgi:AbrB family looped-hinge helix DNA binding protein
MESIVQAKGQVTLPKEAREELGVRTGDRVTWIRNGAGHWELWTVEQLLDQVGPSLDQVGAFSRRAKRGYNPKRA